MDKTKSKKIEKKIKINSINMKEVTDDSIYYRMYVDAITLPERMYFLAKAIDEHYGYLESRDKQVFELEGYISDDGKVNELSLVYYFDEYITIADIDNEDDEDCNQIIKAFEEFASKYGSRLPDNGELSLGDCEYIEKIPQDLKDEWGL